MLGTALHASTVVDQHIHKSPCHWTALGPHEGQSITVLMELTLDPGQGAKYCKGL